MAVSVLRNKHTISAKIAEILSKFPKGHNRRDAFDAITAAGLVSEDGKPLIPSVWYHAVAMVPKANGKTIMQELYPAWTATPSPYARESKISVQNVSRQVSTGNAVPVKRTDLNRISRTLEALSNEVNGLLGTVVTETRQRKQA